MIHFGMNGQWLKHKTNSLIRLKWLIFFSIAISLDTSLFTIFTAAKSLLKSPRYTDPYILHLWLNVANCIQARSNVFDSQTLHQGKHLQLGSAVDKTSKNSNKGNVITFLQLQMLKSPSSLDKTGERRQTKQGGQTSLLLARAPYVSSQLTVPWLYLFSRGPKWEF